MARLRFFFCVFAMEALFLISRHLHLLISTLPLSVISHILSGSMSQVCLFSLCYLRFSFSAIAAAGSLGAVEWSALSMVFLYAWTGLFGLMSICRNEKARSPTWERLLMELHRDLPEE